jgi:hypothetical protein
MTTSLRSGGYTLNIERLVLLPWIWLKRSRGWWRRGLLALYFLVAVGAALLGWRVSCLRGLPDVGDPFDVAAFEAIEVPESENGFAFYRKAVEHLVDKGQPQDPSRIWLMVRGSWKNVDQSARAWTESNGEALDLWGQGTERSKALASSLKTITVQDEPNLLPRLDTLGTLALFDAARLEDLGDMAGAWRSYRRVLRFNRHLQSYGRLRAQMYVSTLDSLVRDRLIVWARDSRTDPSLVRQALDELVAQDANVLPASQSLKVEYLALMHSLNDPVKLMLESERNNGGGYPFAEIKGWHLLVWFFIREPERSRRVVRLAFANRLAQCDKPESQRPRMIGNDPRYPTMFFYEADPSAPYAARALSPKQIDDWLWSSPIALRFMPSFYYFEPKLEPEARSRATAIVHLAEALYERENGKPPASAELLVGRYLKVLPRAYEDPDHVAKREPSDAR